MKARLKVNGFIIFLVVLLIVVFPGRFLRNRPLTGLDAVAKIFGIAFIILGQLFRASGRGFKSEHSLEGKALVKEGPYALVRNPMYLGIILIGLGIILMLFQWWASLIFLLVFISRYVVLIFEEEGRLEKGFSREFQDYRKKVPRIIPSLATILKTDLAEYLPLKFSWLKRESGAILAVLCIALILESWQGIRYSGSKVYFKEAIAISSILILFACVIGDLIKRTEG